MWIARNKDNSLRLFHNKPYKSTDEWKSKYDEADFYLPEENFSYLKWEDEPIEVCLVPTEYVNNFIDDIEQEIEQEKEYVRNLRDNF